LEVTDSDKYDRKVMYGPLPGLEGGWQFVVWRNGERHLLKIFEDRVSCRRWHDRTRNLKEKKLFFLSIFGSKAKVKWSDLRRWDK